MRAHVRSRRGSAVQPAGRRGPPARNALDGSSPRATPILGPRDDAFEREADRVAEEVVATRASDGAAPRVTGAAPGIQRKCAACDEETVRGKDAAVSGPVAPRVAQGIARSRGGGRPLSGAERTFFQPRFGHSFASVRIHDDARAAALSSEIGARAFTIGEDIFVGASEYRAETVGGRRLLAHELAHTLQQAGPAGQGGLVQRLPTSGEQGTQRPEARPQGDSDPCSYEGRGDKAREVHLNLHGCARLHDADASSTASGDSDAFFGAVHDGDCVRIYDRQDWRQPTFKHCPPEGESC